MNAFMQFFALILLALVTSGLTISVYLLWRERKNDAFKTLAGSNTQQIPEERLNQLHKAVEHWLGTYREQTQESLTLLETQLELLQDEINKLKTSLEPSASVAPMPPAPSIQKIKPVEESSIVESGLPPQKLPECPQSPHQQRTQILALHQQGVGVVEIARQLKASRHEVQMIIGLAQRREASS